MDVKMQIDRPKYLNELIVRKNNGLIKVVTGIRRCGKSYLLFTIYKKYLLDLGIPEDHFIEVAFDSRDNEYLRNPDELCKYINLRIIDKKVYYIFLDEIQFVQDFEAVLNQFLRKPNVDIYVTGSNSKFLSSDVITEFRGRGDEIRIHPLSFSEFYPAYSALGHGKEDAWIDYYTYGGLALVLSMRTDAQKIDYLKKLFDEVYARDIIARNKIKNAGEFNELLNVISSSIGSLTNPLKLSNTFKSKKGKSVSSSTILKYLSFAKDAFLINEAQRFDVKGRKHINSAVKYYFEDLGIRNARLNFRQLEENHIMENAIYNELLFRKFNVDIGVVETREKDRAGKPVRKQLEIDFIANSGNRRYYLQSAYRMDNEAKRVQENNSLMKVGDSFKKIIIVRDNIKSYYDENGILIIGLLDFLLDDKSLER
jgi:predicted AAA+ superfamily ATPase